MRFLIRKSKIFKVRLKRNKKKFIINNFKLKNQLR